MVKDENIPAQMQPDELLSVFVKRDDKSFDRLLNLVKERMQFAMSNRQRNTPTLLPSALFMVLSEHQIQMSVVKACELLGVKPSAVYQRAFTIKDLLKGGPANPEPSKSVLVAPEPVKIQPVEETPSKRVDSLKKDVQTSIVDLQREKETKLKEIDSINAIESRMKEIEAKIDTHVQIKSINEKLDILTEILTKQAREIQPVIEEPTPVNIVPVPVEKKEKTRTKHLILADFNTVLNYAIMVKEKDAIGATIEAISKSVSAEGGPFDLMVYIYISGNFSSRKGEIKNRLNEKLLKIPGSQVDIHVFVTDERKGVRKNGNRKFQDTDVFIIDKACEILINEVDEIKVVHLTSGDIDMIPIVWRARKSGIRVKLIAYEDTLSERMFADAGHGSFIRII